MKQGFGFGKKRIILQMNIIKTPFVKNKTALLNPVDFEANPANIALCQLKVCGGDAQSFLQGQLSNDIDKIADGKWQLNAYCQHQGRIIALLWVGKYGADFYLVLPLDLQELVLNRLKMFALNAKISIEKTQQNHLQLPDLKYYPQICIATSEKFIPQDLNLDIDEAGVSFSKGCYPGQEVVARVHYLGKPKRRLYQFEGDFEVLAMDVLTTKDGVKLGAVVNQVKSHFFATLKVANEHSDIFIKNQSVKLIKSANFKL